MVINIFPQLLRLQVRPFLRFLRERAHSLVRSVRQTVSFVGRKRRREWRID